MKVKTAVAFLALFMFTGAAALATVQDTTKTTHMKTRTLTGCLQKGDEANEYKLTTAKGATWEIKSDAVKLGDHVARTPRWECWNRDEQEDVAGFSGSSIYEGKNA